ncbi:MAG: hypothetical protein H0U92_14440, partial [Actinobacteria bacterium]|nr:hypothetical protein [Actinomycetota bacterium]
MDDVQFYVNVAIIGLAAGAVYAVFGLGITMIYKATRVPNFAHAAIGMFGAYVFFKTWDQVGELRNPFIRLQVPFAGWSWQADPPRLPLLFSLLLAMAVAAIIGLGIEKLVMRRVAGAPTLNMIIITVAMLTVLTGL